MFLEEMANPYTIVESDDYGQKLYFDYQKIRKGQQVMSHPSPVVLYLGTWRMTDRFNEKKKFLCGLNLAVLADEEELAAVQQALPDILKSKNMKSRYRIGKTLLPDIFRKAYRTYNLQKISTRPIKGRLYALQATSQDKEEAEKIASNEYPYKDWGELDPDTRSELIDKAIQARGADDVERQEQAKQDRKELEPELAKPRKPEPAKPPKPPKPAKPPKAPKTPAPVKAFAPLELGSEFEIPKPEMEHPPVQSPIKSVETGMITPHKIKIGQNDPTQKPRGKRRIRKLPPADWEERAKQVAQRRADETDQLRDKLSEAKQEIQQILIGAKQEKQILKEVVEAEKQTLLNKIKADEAEKQALRETIKIEKQAAQDEISRLREEIHKTPSISPEENAKRQMLANLAKAVIRQRTANETGPEEQQLP